MRLVVGVTGSIGGGKSTFARLLMQAVDGRGAEVVVLDADRMARDVVESAPEAPEVRAELASRFGADVLRSDGSLDRALLASRAFLDERSTAALNGIIHPRVVAVAERALAGKDGVFILDVPLLFESGMDRLCDVTIAVTAPREVRLARAARFVDAEERERRQWPEERKAAAANVVVANDATLDELAVHARAVAEKLLLPRP